ncbi:MAG: hypothetical protein WCT26_01205 [Candidatus Buchananbacteria bacterium]
MDKNLAWLILTFIILFNITPVYADSLDEYVACINDCINNTAIAETQACYDDCVKKFPKGLEACSQASDQQGKFVSDGTICGTGGTPAANTPCGKTFCLNVPIGNLLGFNISKDAGVSGNTILGDYIKQWYGFLLGTIGIMATVMIMWGGFKYLTSRGDKGVIDTAKAQIISAITGVALAFGTYSILMLINPQLLTINTPTLPGLQGGGNVNLQQPYSPNANSVTINGVTYNRNANGAFPDAAYVTHNTATYIAANEGYFSTVQNDSLGNPTIGYGHKCTPDDYKPGGICSGLKPEQVQEQATELFYQQTGQAGEAASALLANAPTPSITDDRLMVVTDLLYNVPGLAQSMPLTYQALQQGKWEEAANQLLYANGTPGSGSTAYATQVGNRARRNAMILRTGNAESLQ